MQGDRPNTRQKILGSAYELFYRQGFSRVSVDAIADRAGVTKRTIYYHFASKDDIVAGVLDVQHLLLIEQVQSWIGESPCDSSQMLDRLFSGLKDWADGPGWLGSGFTRITMELADMPGHPARAAASRHKSAVEKWIADNLSARGNVESHDLARQIMILIEGAMSLSLIHGDRRYIQSSAKAALQLFKAQQG